MTLPVFPLRSSHALPVDDIADIQWVERPPGYEPAHPDELPAIERAVSARREEFISARACGRAALARLRPEWSGAAIPRRDDGRAVWPSGVVGSISHCSGLRAAAVAYQTDVASLGIDVETARPLPEEVAVQTLDPRERRLLATAGVLDTVGFSIKEALFKSWWPMTGEWLDFGDAVIQTLSPMAAGVALHRTHPAWPAHVLRVRWRIDAEFVRAAAWIPSPEAVRVPAVTDGVVGRTGCRRTTPSTDSASP